MSEPHKGEVSTLTIRSVAGGFIVSWQVFDRENYSLQYAQAMGAQVIPTKTVERVCAGLPALLALISDTIRVTA